MLRKIFVLFYSRYCMIIAHLGQLIFNRRVNGNDIVCRRHSSWLMFTLGNDAMGASQRGHIVEPESFFGDDGVRYQKGAIVEPSRFAPDPQACVKSLSLVDLSLEACTDAVNDQAPVAVIRWSPSRNRPRSRYNWLRCFSDKHLQICRDTTGGKASSLNRYVAVS